MSGPLVPGEIRRCSCLLALRPCPAGKDCAEGGFVHARTMGHECPPPAFPPDGALTAGVPGTARRPAGT